MVAALLLVVSIFYDYSFLLAIGLSFDDIPSSLAEHVRSAILWAPKLLLTALFYFIIEMFLRRVEGGRSEEELIASSPNPRFTRAYRNSADKLPVIWAVGATLLGAAFSPDWQWLYLGFMLVWGTLSLSVVMHPRMGTSFRGFRARLIVSAPIVLAFVGLFGYQAGLGLLHSGNPKWEVVVRDGSTTSQQRLWGIRRFGSFAIAVDQSRSVSILPNDSILSIKTVSQPKKQSCACAWFGVLCLSGEHTVPNKSVILCC